MWLRRKWEWELPDLIDEGVALGWSLMDRYMVVIDSGLEIHSWMAADCLKKLCMGAGVDHLKRDSK